MTRLVFKHHRVPLASYVNQLTNGIQINDEYKKFNLCLTSGGIAGVYQAGVTAYLYSLYTNNNIDINKIYGASAGACAGAFIIYMLTLYDKKLPKYDADDFMEMFHTTLQEESANENHYMVNGWRNVMRNVFPDDIHLYCNDKLVISIHVIENFCVVQKEISTFDSKEHLIEVISTSMSIPFLTIPTFFKTYYCPYKKKRYFAFDGIFTPQIKEKDLIYPTLVVNLHHHSYPYTKRLRLLEKSYDFLAIEGIQDAHTLFKDQKNTSSLYFEKPQTKHKLNRFAVIHVFFFFLLLLKTPFSK